jgi:hypothetical protein
MAGEYPVVDTRCCRAIVAGMGDEIPIPKGGAAGWIAAVSRSKGQPPVRYYICIADKEAAQSAIRATLKLGGSATVDFRHALSRQDADVLNLRPGEVRKC